MNLNVYTQLVYFVILKNFYLVFTHKLNGFSCHILVYVLYYYDIERLC